MKAGPRKKASPKHDEFVARLIEACAEHRVIRLLYYSVHSNREKDYELHPYNLAYAEGRLYLTAYVPEYTRCRCSRWSASAASPCSNAAHAGGGPDHRGLRSLAGREPRPEARAHRVKSSRRVAPYVGERTWHASQQLEPLPDGGTRLTLKVCRDWALRTWVLGWGSHARVVAPAALADEILQQLEEAREGYVPKLVFESPLMFDRPTPQTRLPLRS